MIPSRKAYSTGNPQWDQTIHDIIEKTGLANSDLLEEMIFTAFKLSQESTDRGDIKLINTTLKELRYAFKVFKPYRQIRKVAIFGSARTSRTAPEYLQARDFARHIVKKKWM